MTRRIKIILITSLVLNILLAGIGLGALSHCLFWPAPLSHTLPEMAAQLPGDKRKLFEDTMHDAWQDVDKLHEQMVEAKKESGLILSAEPFNAEAYMTQIHHMEDIHTHMKQRLAEAIIELAKQFTPQERAVLTDAIAISKPATAQPSTSSTGLETKKK